MGQIDKAKQFFDWEAETGKTFAMKIIAEAFLIFEKEGTEYLPFFFPEGICFQMRYVIPYMPGQARVTFHRGHAEAMLEFLEPPSLLSFTYPNQVTINKISKHS